MVPGISIAWRLILVFLFTLIHELGHWVMFKIICKNNFEFRWEATENKKVDKLFKSKKLTPVFDTDETKLTSNQIIALNLGGIIPGLIVIQLGAFFLNMGLGEIIIWLMVYFICCSNDINNISEAIKNNRKVIK